MNTEKKLAAMAKKDAERAAFADMFYGEGAGTHRKLLKAELTPKFEEIEGYTEAFDAAYNSLNMNKFAEAAIKERKRLDRAAKAGRNLRALKSGNYSNLTTGVAVVVGAAYLAHATGYDKKIEAEARKLYKKAKTEIKFRKMKAQGLNVERIV